MECCSFSRNLPDGGPRTSFILLAFNQSDEIKKKCKQILQIRFLCFQFDAVENGMRISKMMQVFSKQAPMMDALISHFVEQTRRRRTGENGQPLENVAEGKC